MVAVSVAVLIPWRSDGSLERERNKAIVTGWWMRTHPEWELVEGTCPEGPWVKGVAIADALARTTAGTLVIADADVWCTDTSYAVRAVEHGVPWAIPHQKVHRLTEEVTQALAAKDLMWADLHHVPAAQRPYDGVPAGGLVVVDRDLYESCPFDPRFQGWTVLAGPPRRGTEPLLHLWHEPQKRMGRVIGSPEGKALRDRYRTATTPMGVLAIANEHT
jgi:hypothetical protein